MIGRDEILIRFQYNDQSEEDKARLKELCLGFVNLATDIDNGMEDCREKSSALTKLEECMFYVYAAFERSRIELRNRRSK